MNILEIINVFEFVNIYDVSQYKKYTNIESFMSWLTEIQLHRTSRFHLFDACIKGNVYLANLFDINSEEYEFSIRQGLKNACMHGHWRIVNLMIKRGANNWNDGLCGACFGGQYEIANFMISRGANNWKLALYGACTGGHWNIIYLLMNRGVMYWNYGLEGACRGGHL